MTDIELYKAGKITACQLARRISEETGIHYSTAHSRVTSHMNEEEWYKPVSKKTNPKKKQYLYEKKDFICYWWWIEFVCIRRNSMRIQALVERYGE